jgi:hypothetical protein
VVVVYRSLTLVCWIYDLYTHYKTLQLKRKHTCEHSRRECLLLEIECSRPFHYIISHCCFCYCYCCSPSSPVRSLDSCFVPYYVDVDVDSCGEKSQSQSQSYLTGKFPTAISTTLVSIYIHQSTTRHIRSTIHILAESFPCPVGYVSRV